MAHVNVFLTDCMLFTSADDCFDVSHLSVKDCRKFTTWKAKQWLTYQRLTLPGLTSKNGKYKRKFNYHCFPKTSSWLVGGIKEWTCIPIF